MDEKLLEDVGSGRPGSGTRGRQTGPVTGGGRRSGDDDADDWPWTKRLRLQRHASLGSADDDRQSTKSSSDTGRPSTASCFRLRPNCTRPTSMCCGLVGEQVLPTSRTSSFMQHLEVSSWRGSVAGLRWTSYEIVVTQLMNVTNSHKALQILND